jgi:P4 family phage/plasmid primase-like protien
MSKTSKIAKKSPCVENNDKVASTSKPNSPVYFPKLDLALEYGPCDENSHNSSAVLCQRVFEGAALGKTYTFVREKQVDEMTVAEMLTLNKFDDEHQFAAIDPRENPHLEIQNKKIASEMRAFVWVDTNILHKFVVGKNLHEVICGERKLFFDLDISDENFEKVSDDFESPDQICDFVIASTIEFAPKFGFKQTPEFDIFTRHRSGKFSFHLVCNNLAFVDANIHKIFNENFVSGNTLLMKLFNAKILDLLHKQNQNFAIPYSSKQSADGTLNKLIYADQGEEPAISHARCLVTRFLDQTELITKTTMVSVSLSAAKPKRSEPSVIEDKQVAEYLALFEAECPDLAAKFVYKSSKDGFINFVKVSKRESVFCDICERTHDSDNFLVLTVQEDHAGGILVRGCKRNFIEIGPKKFKAVASLNVTSMSDEDLIEMGKFMADSGEEDEEIPDETPNETPNDDPMGNVKIPKITGRDDNLAMSEGKVVNTTKPSTKPTTKSTTKSSTKVTALQKKLDKERLQKMEQETLDKNIEQDDVLREILSGDLSAFYVKHRKDSLRVLGGTVGYLYSEKTSLWEKRTIERIKANDFRPFMVDVVSKLALKYKGNKKLNKLLTKDLNDDGFLSKQMKLINASDDIYDGEFEQKLNNDPESIATNDGCVVNLRTKERRIRTRSDYWSETINAHLVDDPNYEVVEQYFKNICDGRVELMNYLRELLGFCLSGKVEQKIYTFIGERASNGKSELINRIQELLGWFASPIDAELLFGKNGFGGRSNGPRPDLISLIGKRFVYCNEPDTYMVETRNGDRVLKFEPGFVKKTTDKSMFKARDLYCGSKDMQTFELPAKFVILSNHRPQIPANDEGMARRVVSVPFDHVFSSTDEKEKQKNAAFIELFKSKIDSFFTWLVDGSANALQNGITVPVIVQNDTLNTISQARPHLSFVADMCESGEGIRIVKSELYEAYQTYCRENGFEYLSNVMFGKEMCKKYKVLQSNNVRYYVGIQLKEDEISEEFEVPLD